jgi:protoheme IX farnesyltransferase
MKNSTQESELPLSSVLSVRSQIRAYAALSKLRLSSLVIFSAAAGYCTASPSPWNYTAIALLALGGLLITASANGFNQVFEREYDKLMFRTQNRPLATGVLTVREALIFCLVSGLLGLGIIAWAFSFQTFLLGLVALLSYAFVYTPLKRITPFAVLVGAFPGAIPPLLGFVAFSDTVNPQAWTLFAVQFVWQFPHFWAIAWLLHDDYSRAGFKLLPHSGGQSPQNARTILLYSLLLIPVSLLPMRYGLGGEVALGILLASALMMSLCAIYLYRDCSLKSARYLMFSSFIYLPAVQLALVFDRI